MADVGPPFADDYMIAELDAIAMRALAQGDEYSRELLRTQRIGEEFAESLQLDRDVKAAL